MFWERMTRRLSMRLFCPQERQWEIRISKMRPDLEFSPERFDCRPQSAEFYLVPLLETRNRRLFDSHLLCKSDLRLPIQLSDFLESQVFTSGLCQQLCKPFYHEFRSTVDFGGALAIRRRCTDKSERFSRTICSSQSL